MIPDECLKFELSQLVVAGCYACGILRREQLLTIVKSSIQVILVLDCGNSFAITLDGMYATAGFPF